MLPNGNIALLRYLHKHANLAQTTHFLNKIKERKKAKNPPQQVTNCPQLLSK